MRVIYIHERLHIYSSVCTFIRFRGGENVQSPSGVLRRGATGVCGRAMQSILRATLVFASASGVRSFLAGVIATPRTIPSVSRGASQELSGQDRLCHLAS